MIFYFLDSSIKYLLNATFRTIIACQMCVLEILERGEAGGGRKKSKRVAPQLEKKSLSTLFCSLSNPFF